jgi:hypothetical protein
VLPACWVLAPDWSASALSVRPATPFPTPDSLAAELFPVPARSHWPHNGVLFLDELPEFPRNVLEVMRQPLEDETVCIARASTSLTFPARFMLAEAMNPCPCGYLTIVGASAVALRQSFNATCPRFQGHCWIGSTSTSTCPL